MVAAADNAASPLRFECLSLAVPHFKRLMRKRGALFTVVMSLASLASAEDLFVRDGEIWNLSLKGFSFETDGDRYTGGWRSLNAGKEKFTPIVFYKSDPGLEPQVGCGYGPKDLQGRRKVRFFCKPYSDGPDLKLQRKTIYFFYADGNKRRQVEKIGTFDVADSEEEVRKKALAALKKYIEQRVAR